MKNLKYLWAFIFSGLISCNQEENIPSFGEGNGRLGFGFVISSDNNPGARLLQDYILIENGFVQIEELELELDGKDDLGQFEKEIEIEFDNIKKVEFDRFDTTEDFFINIPEGEYQEIEMEIELIDFKNEPSIFLSGEYIDEENNAIPLIFEYFDDEIEFEIEIESEDDDQFFRVDKIENPLVLFELNPRRWFENVTMDELQEAEKIDGVIILNKNYNQTLFAKVAMKIKNEAEIEIEIR